MSRLSLETVPTANLVRAELTAARAEVRALRKLLGLAKEAELAKAARQAVGSSLLPAANVEGCRR